MAKISSVTECVVRFQNGDLREAAVFTLLNPRDLSVVPDNILIDGIIFLILLLACSG